MAGVVDDDRRKRPRAVARTDNSSKATTTRRRTLTRGDIEAVAEGEARPRHATGAVSPILCDLNGFIEKAFSLAEIHDTGGFPSLERLEGENHPLLNPCVGL